jgi:hypothetical protein
MLILGAYVLLQHQILDVKLSLDNTLVVIPLQGFLTLPHIG